MGRAIIREPAVFLMDEPLSNLDAKLRVQMRAEIAALQARLGVTTVYVTHDQVEAMTLGHRVAVLRDGRLQQCDTPRGLYDHPVNVFVAGFIGSPAMTLCTRAAGRTARRRWAARAWGCPARRNGARASVVVGLRPESLELAGDGVPRPGPGRRGARRRRLRVLHRRARRQRGAARRPRRRRASRRRSASACRCSRAPARRTCSTPTAASASGPNGPRAPRAAAPPPRRTPRRAGARGDRARRGRSTSR